MRRLLFAAAALALAACAPAKLGTYNPWPPLLQLPIFDGGTVAAPQQLVVTNGVPNTGNTGAMYYDSVLGVPQFTDGGVWAPLVPGSITPAGLAGSASQYLYNGYAPNGGNSTVAIQDVGSFDSLVPSRISALYWQQQCASGTSQIWMPGLDGGPEPFSDVVDMNNEGTAGVGLFQEAMFSVPSGVSSVTLNATMKKGANDTGTTSVGFTTTATCSADVQHTTATLTNGWVTYSNTRTGLSVANNYFAIITGNAAGFGSSTTSDALISSVQLKPNGGTGFWASDFWRVEASPTTMQNNTRTLYWSDGTFRHSPGASMAFESDATQIAIEFEATNSVTTTNYSLPIWVNGRLLSWVTPSSGTAYGEFATVSLPAGLKTVEVQSGYMVSGATGVNDYNGPFLRAVYFPAAATTRVLQPNVPRAFVFYGDSITAGTGATVPMAAGWTQIMRRWLGGRVVIEHGSSKSLFNDIGGTGLTRIGSIVTALTRSAPTDLWIMLGINDYGNTLWTQAQFGTAYASLLDAIHAASPGTQIYATMLLTTEEATVNGNGDTPANFRTQINTACTARPWCAYVDGTTLLAAADISADHIHPLAGAVGKLAVNAFNAMSALASPTSPWVIPTQYVGNATPQVIAGLNAATVMSNATAVGSYALPGVNSVGGTTPKLTLTALSANVTGASGGGAANTVITATDQTNTCTYTIPCNSNTPAGSQNTGLIRIAGVNGAGTGCAYANAAKITWSVTTAGCTTTQPTFSGLSFEANWR